MPRISRKNFETSFFHVMVQGIRKEYIFNQKIAIKKYVELLNNERENFDLEILAYCVMNNHAHLLIYTKRIEEMSLYMHTINQKFAQFYNYINQGRVGYVFRDRYKSQIIYSEKQLYNYSSFALFLKISHNCQYETGLYPFWSTPTSYCVFLILLFTSPSIP